jgi:hypothetical protein
MYRYMKILKKVGKLLSEKGVLSRVFENIGRLVRCALCDIAFSLVILA